MLSPCHRCRNSVAQKIKGHLEAVLELFATIAEDMK